MTAADPTSVALVAPQRRPRSGLLTWVLVIDARSVHWCLARRASLVLVALGLAPLSSLPDPRRRSALVLSRSACLWFHVKQQVGDLITLPAIDVPGVRAHSRLTPDRGGSSPSPLLPSTTHDREASSSGATPTPDLPERRDCSAGPSLNEDPLAGRFARLVKDDVAALGAARWTRRPTIDAGGRNGIKELAIVRCVARQNGLPTRISAVRLMCTLLQRRGGRRVHNFLVSAGHRVLGHHRLRSMTA